MYRQSKHLLIANDTDVLACDNLFEFLIDCCRIKDNDVYVTMPGYKEMLVFGYPKEFNIDEDSIVFTMMKILRSPDKNTYWPTIELYKSY